VDAGTIFSRFKFKFSARPVAVSLCVDKSVEAFPNVPLIKNAWRKEHDIRISHGICLYGPKFLGAQFFGFG
jgi:hypothetical protein